MKLLRGLIQKLGFLALLGGMGAFLFAALGYKFGLIDLGMAFGTLNRKVAPLLLAGAGALGLLGLLLGLFIRPRKGILLSLVTLLVPAAGLYHAKSVGDKVATLPFIHDISTDTATPPNFSDTVLALRNETPGVNTVDYAGKTDERDNRLVSELQTEAYPDIQTVMLSGSQQAVYAAALATAAQQGWTIHNEGLNENFDRIEATDTTFWYGFKDDITIRITPEQNGQTAVDIRSVSRVGKSDMGKNADRIRQYSQALKARAGQ